MQLKWLEDLLALAKTRSFSRAAELRQVTHPAFGRRIKSLEDWAGTALVMRGSSPVTLTAAGERLMADASDLLHGVEQARDALLGVAGQGKQSVTLATGRTLARNLVADWMPRLMPLLEKADGELHVRTQSLAQTAQLFERGEADFMLTYHHPLLAVRLNARQYSHLTLAQDRLVPVTRCEVLGKARYDFKAGVSVPYLAYADTLALGRLGTDHLTNHPQAPLLCRSVVCDSADAMFEYILKGAGVAWLPWSLVAVACNSGQLAVIGDARLEVAFEARLYRPKRTLGTLAEAVWQMASSH
jgi:DNA-binding transcriptional LysR family regulator